VASRVGASSAGANATVPRHPRRDAGTRAPSRTRTPSAPRAHRGGESDERPTPSVRTLPDDANYKSQNGALMSVRSDRIGRHTPRRAGPREDGARGGRGRRRRRRALAPVRIGGGHDHALQGARTVRDGRASPPSPPLFRAER
jgi:hypothetical protein